MLTVKRFTFQNKEFSDWALAIRRVVFVEEQHVDPELEYEHEEESSHYLLFLGEKPIAAARWRETEMGVKLERFAVLPQFRNRGFGEVILKEILKDVAPMEKRIYLHAQLKAVTFYERNGFIKFGEQFTEAGIEHFLMKYHD